MRLSFRQEAEEHEVYAPGAFDDLVGKRVPMKLDGETVGMALLVSAEVAEDGRSVLLTVDGSVGSSGA